MADLRKKKSIFHKIITMMLNWLHLKNEIKVCRHYYAILKDISNRPRIPDNVKKWRKRDNINRRRDISVLRAKLEMRNRVEIIGKENKV